MPLFTFRKKRKASTAVPSSELKWKPTDTILRQMPALPISPSCSPRYRPIDSRKKEIRLLKVLAGGDNAPLQCELDYTFVSLDSRLPYETVSYRWDRLSNEIIYMDRVAVITTSSAAQALRQFRYRDAHRMLWIDAICIDQSDKRDEKGQQVALMGEIYRNSTCNLIWLGHDKGDSLKTYNAMLDVQENIRFHVSDPSDFTLMMNMPTRIANRDHTLLNTNIDLQPLIGLFSSPWWRRVWVAQEAVLAPNNQCHYGNLMIPFQQVLDVAAWLDYNQIQLHPEFAQNPSRLAASSMARLMYNKRRHCNDLFKIYTYLQDFQATDPKDYIYAMLGFFQRQTTADWFFELVQPDYKRPTKDVFRDATRYMILDGGHLSVLHFIDNRNTSENFPSWAVRFDLKTVHDHDPVCRLVEFNATNASDFPESQIGMFTPYQSSDPRVLILGGFRVAKIKACTSVLEGREAWRTDRHKKLMDLIISLAKSRRGPENKNWGEELAHALLAGTNWRHERPGYEEIEGFKRFLQYTCKYPNRPPVPLDGHRYDETHMLESRWFVAFEEATRNQRFFVMYDGRIGLGPAGLRPGDCVAILFGGSVPFVLRRQEAHYYLVGECYVHGIMYGEFVRERKIAHDPTFPFSLR